MKNAGQRSRMVYDADTSFFTTGFLTDWLKQHGLTTVAPCCDGKPPGRLVSLHGNSPLHSNSRDKNITLFVLTNKPDQNIYCQGSYAIRNPETWAAIRFLILIQLHWIVKPALNRVVISAALDDPEACLVSPGPANYFITVCVARYTVPASRRCWSQSKQFHSHDSAYYRWLYLGHYQRKTADITKHSSKELVWLVSHNPVHRQT